MSTHLAWLLLVLKNFAWGIFISIAICISQGRPVLCHLFYFFSTFPIFCQKRRKCLGEFWSCVHFWCDLCWKNVKKCFKKWTNFDFHNDFRSKVIGSYTGSRLQGRCTVRHWGKGLSHIHWYLQNINMLKFATAVLHTWSTKGRGLHEM